MVNLFSIFDPATAYFSNSNWLAMFLYLILIPVPFWMAQTQLNVVLISPIKFILNEFKPLMMKSPYVLILSTTFFIIIAINNLSGLLPYVFTAPAHLLFNLTLALPVWLALTMWSWINNRDSTLIHLIPQGTPLGLMPFMVLIETISNVIRPLTLAVRLTANMIAGHLLIVLVSSAFTHMTLNSMVPLMVAEFALTSLELAVAVIQAYVFSVLVTLYAAEAIN